MNPCSPRRIINNTQSERKKVWLNAWYSMATNNDIESIEVCTKAADECLKAFDERFGQ